MNKKTVLGLMALMLTFALTCEVFALDQGNDRKGKYTYRKVYKACFDRGAVTSEVPPLSPNTRSQAQWEHVFTSKDFAQFGCGQEWQQLSAEDVRDIYTYLYNHASDSPSPATCK